MPRFTVITPSLQRESLVRACDSLNAQTFTDWQHVVMVDCETINPEMLARIYHPRRVVVKCSAPHRNFGNTCRHNAWDYATGDMIFYLDDDNYFADANVLEDMAIALKDNPEWAIFPMLRHGQWFFTDPPRSCHADTANVVVKRRIGRWPDGPQYTMDGIWIDALVAAHPYQAFPTFRPIVIMEASNLGRLP